MIILGTIYLVDEPHIDVLKQNLMSIPPPEGRPATGTMLCLDMDETDNLLEMWFPQHCQKATILCPPPEAMRAEIDGEQEKFIQIYNNYLEYDPVVQDLIASLLLFLHLGGNILLYTPSYIEDDAIWINVLCMFFYTRFGITIGTSISGSAGYDPNYDSSNAVFMYSKGVMDPFDFIASNPELYPNSQIIDQLCCDLAPYCHSGMTPIALYDHIIQVYYTTGRMTKPFIRLRE